VGGGWTRGGGVRRSSLKQAATPLSSGRAAPCISTASARRAQAGAPRAERGAPAPPPALREIERRPVCEGARLHFVDDRLETLKAAVEAGLAGGWALYLADWCEEGGRGGAGRGGAGIAPPSLSLVLGAGGGRRPSGGWAEAGWAGPPASAWLVGLASVLGGLQGRNRMTRGVLECAEAEIFRVLTARSPRHPTPLPRPRGYCTDEEKAEVAQLPGVRRLRLRDFLELLKWWAGVVFWNLVWTCRKQDECAATVGGWWGAGGRHRAPHATAGSSPPLPHEQGATQKNYTSRGLVAGVDDGCEPTEEEVRKGVT
jgi:hypothetical protein